MAHSRTRKKSLTEERNEYFLSISYKCILEIRNSITNQLCKLCDVQRSVCPPRLQENIFTVSAIDNLDLFMILALVFFSFKLIRMIHSNLNCQKPPAIMTVHQVSYYTNVKPTQSTSSTPRISTINSMNSLDADHFDQSKD